MIVSGLSAGAWTALTLAWLAAVMMPGPDVFLLMRLAIRERRAAVLAALGIMSGNLLWILFSVLGLAVLLDSLPWLLPALQLAGALVLGWIGAQSIRSGIRGLRRPDPEEIATGPRRPWLLGLVTNLSNPKALVFFTALLAQFLPPGTELRDRVVVIVLMSLTGLAWFLAVALACSAAAFRRWFRRAAPWLDIVAGGVFALVSAVVLVELVLAVLAGS
ncbi:LysE family translocator [Leucobacter sp. CSA1]|uniref:LysE family translocator n=1 Tax=Leucobacter chromiisoli TaxID=2796471 RepID=A0A934QBD3_9MICO|nr:LysE family translocator [Leucobacter chromiisoli]MBK0420192.1 LysE family translocator [Leucobacter chromiisoli]